MGGKGASGAIAPIGWRNLSLDLDGAGTATTESPAIDERGPRIVHGNAIFQQNGAKIGSAIAGNFLAVGIDGGHGYRDCNGGKWLILCQICLRYYEQRFVREIGVGYLQGYFIDSPQPLTHPQLSEHL